MCGAIIYNLFNAKLFDGDFGAADRFAGEGANLAAFHLDDAVFGGMDGEVAANGCAFTWALCLADLANDDLTGFDSLAAK